MAAGIRLGLLVPPVKLAAKDMAGALSLPPGTLAKVAETVRDHWDEQRGRGSKAGMRLVLELDVPPEPGMVEAVLRQLVSVRKIA